MANRYWVGGTATWDNTAGTKWATTSGGAGGASVPTSVDDVFFDASSTGTCTISGAVAVAKSINCTGFTGTITGTGSITVSGSVTLVAGMTYSHTGTMTINGTGTLTTAGKAFSQINIFGSGITVTLGDALNLSTRRITVTQGTFTTANFNVTAIDLYATGSLTRTINLGSSTLTLSGGDPIQISTITNLTFNSNTSTINLTSSGANIICGALTFYNVSFTSTTSGTRTINGSGITFNNLTLSPASSGIVTLVPNANFTVSGTFNCAGASATVRNFVRSEFMGTQTQITAGTLLANDCDFRDIKISGTASGTSPTRAGDCGGNLNITFPAAKTVYRVGTNTTFIGSSSWATSSGGAGADTNFPLAQDTAVINNSTTLTGTLNFDATNYNIGAINASSRTTAITFNFNAPLTYYSSFTFGSGVTSSGNSTQTFSGRGTMDFTSAGKAFSPPITVNSPGGTFRLLDSLSATNGIVHTSGFLNLNGQTLTTFSYSTAAGTKNITFNGGTLNVTSSTATAFDNAAPTGFSTTAGTGTGTINMTGATAKTFVGGGSTFNCTLNNGGAGALTITGSNTFTTLANSVQPTSFSFTAGTTTTLTNWNISGTAGNLVTIGSSTAASHTLSKTSGTVSANYLSISRSTATGGATWLAGANSTDGGNNSGWIFSSVNNGNFLMLFM